MTITAKIAADLNTCALVEAFGSRANKRKARAHRKACFAAIADMNRADGLENMSDDDLLAALFA
jgi:hypothetical protein